MNTFKLTVASPDGNKFCGEVVKLDVRGTEGELAIMREERHRENQEM